MKPAPSARNNRDSSSK